MVFKLFNSIIGGPVARKRIVNDLIKASPGTKILDIGCGPGENLDYLPAGVEYLGYDLSPDYIAYAKKRHGRRGQFFCARVSSPPAQTLTGQFDIVSAIAILHHLDDKEAGILFRNAHAQVEDAGVLLVLDPVRIANQPRFAKYLISKDRGQYVRTPAEYTALAAEHFPIVRTVVLHDLLRVPYTHFVMLCAKSNAGQGAISDRLSEDVNHSVELGRAS